MRIGVKGNSKRTCSGGPEQGYRCCFADVTNQKEITSATQATRHVIPG